MHEVLVNRLGGLSLPRKSVVRLTDHPNMTLDVYRGRKTTMQQQQPQPVTISKLAMLMTTTALTIFDSLKSFVNLHIYGIVSPFT